MAANEASLQAIYAGMVQEATERLNAAKRYLSAYRASQDVPDLESSLLQLRKALEAIALASIAPNKSEYAAFRATATNAADFTKDYHALRIFSALEKINKNFYPRALVPAVRRRDGSHHFGRKQTGFLSKKRFEAAYDRLGKHLHAHNPWGAEKHIRNLASDLPGIVEEAHGLLDLHVSFIHTPKYKAAWLVETPRDGSAPIIIVSEAKGEYAVHDS